jgi:hypothetical protein
LKAFLEAPDDNQSLAKSIFSTAGPSEWLKNESGSLKKHYSSIMSLRHFFAIGKHFIDFLRHPLHETGVWLYG